MRSLDLLSDKGSLANLNSVFWVLRKDEKMIGYLVLENGEIFEGERIGLTTVDTACEVVFNTSMVGYLETLTDPSYYGQGIVMTYPLIGNYGVIPEDFESENVWVKAIFVHELAEFESNFRKKDKLNKVLRDYKVPGLTNINTRKLTKILRNEGTMKGYITSSIENMDEIMQKIKEYEIGKVVKEVTSKEIVSYGKNYEKQIVLIDYGFKHEIVNSFLKRNIGVTVCPSNTPAEKILSLSPDGIMLSNGPGDPEKAKEEIEKIKKLAQSNIPILGIGLGHQLMALAHGFKTGRLKYGHRGANHPVKELATGKVHITTQNHGYYVTQDSVNTEVAEVAYVNLNDNTVEGIRYKNGFTVQFYIDDESQIFDKFVESL